MAADIRLTLVVATKPRECVIKEVTSNQTCVKDFLEAQTTLIQGLLGDLATRCVFSVWGNKVSLDYQLCDGDRVEITRPLRVDPKVARRERFQRQGQRRAGLFSKSRNAASYSSEP